MEFDHEFTVPVPVSQAWAVLLDVERIAPCMPGATLDSMDGDEFAGRLRVKLGAMTITYKGTARILSADEQTHVVIIEGSGKEARGSGTATSTVQAELHDEGDKTRVTVHSKLAVTGKPAQFGRNILAEVGGKLIGRFADALSEEISQETSPQETSPQDTGPTVVEQAAAATAPKAPEAPEPAEPTLAEPDVQAKPDAHAKPDARAEPGRQAESLSEIDQSGLEPEVPSVPQPREGGDTGHVAPIRPRPAAEPVNLLEVAGPSVAKRVVPAVAALVFLLLLVRYVLRRRS
jgi:carbon monoxide dehydrogenase subunit G